MALLPPTVVGPLSECSSHVRVEGQLTGSTVDLFANGAPVESAVASWSNQVFPLSAGVTLAAGVGVSATQTLGGQTSQPSPQPVVVQKKPLVVGNVGCKTHLYVCGQCLWLDGMVPGATVDVRVGGVIRGSGRADDGTARFGLSPQTGAGDVLEAQQTACGVAGPVTPLPSPDQLPVAKGQRLLPAPTVQSPLKACQRAVTVSNVFEGGQVVLSQTAGPTEQSCFDQSALWFQTNPLVQGETVSAHQRFPHCHLDSLKSPGVIVGAATPVPSPTVVPPLCAGSTAVQLTGLLPGSQVRISQDGADLGTGEAPDSSFAFEVPPLTGGDVVTARQELCGIWSAASNKVKVNPKPASLPKPVVPGPLYECAAVVRVTNIHPGSVVTIYSTLLAGPISPGTLVDGTQSDIQVAPQLIKADKVYAQEVGCGLTVKSAAKTVQAVVKPGPPQVLPPVEDCMRSVTVGNVLPGARVDVYVNGSWRSTATAGGATVEVPILFGPLHVGDEVSARQRICQYITALGKPTKVVSHLPYYYLTQHFDIARTGWNPYETILTPANVPNLKQLFAHAVDGTVYAQPLYAHHVLLPGKGAHTVVYAATENDTVYAFDADTNQPALWQRSLVPAGESPVADTDIEGCDNIAPKIGITSTPGIDCATYTMYVVAKTKRVQGPTTTFHQRLHALDIATGTDRPGSPREIHGVFPGSAQPNDGHGNVEFDAKWHLNRPGLLLLHGVVYVAFGSHCDAHIGDYHGWVASFNANTLAHLATFCATPDPPANPDAREAAGIWQGGMGLAADSDGFIYCTTGNGDFTANVGGRNFGDTVLKLRAQLSVAGSFTPADQSTLLLPEDADLGSGGVVVIPDRPARSRHPKLMVTCGKDGDIFLIDRNNLGGYNGPAGPDLVVQALPIHPGVPKDQQPGVWGGPAYYRGQTGELVYYCGSHDHLKAFSLQTANLSLSHIGANPNQSPNAFPREGGVTPNVSSNQQTAGTGVVWAITRSNPLRLRAFDAANLTKQLFDQPAGAWNNPDGGAFIEPTVIQGKVYAGSDGQLTVFGL
jgi:hypothetical protein